MENKQDAFAKAEDKFRAWRRQYDADAMKLGTAEKIRLGKKEYNAALEMDYQAYKDGADEKRYFWKVYRTLVADEIKRVSGVKRIRISFTFPSTKSKVVFMA